MIAVLLYTLGDAVLVIPGIMAAETGRDAWIAGIASIGVGLLLVSFYCSIAGRHPDKTLVQYSEAVLGRWMGKAISLLYLWFMFILCSILLREVGDFLTTLVLPETPIQAIMMLFLGVAVWGARLGINTIARAAEVFLPWIVLMFFVGVVFLLPEAKFEKAMPILENGVLPLLPGIYVFSAIPFVELSVFLMVLPAVESPDRTRLPFAIGALTGGLALLLVITLCILVLGAEETARQQYPTYSVSRQITFGDWLQRMEIVLAGTWFITIFFKLTIALYSLCTGFSQWLGGKSGAPLAMPVGILVLVVSLAVAPNIVTFNESAIRNWPAFAMTCGIMIPALLWAADWIKCSMTEDADE